VPLLEAELNLLVSLQGEAKARVVAVMEKVEEGMVVVRVRAVAERVKVVLGMGAEVRVRVVAVMERGVVGEMEVEAKVAVEMVEAGKVKVVAEMVVEERAVVVKEGGWVGKGWVEAVNPAQEGEVVGCSGIDVIGVEDRLELPCFITCSDLLSLLADLAKRL
jgi:hypothetical protein